MEKISFNMASIPQRIDSLRETVDSIINQCHELNIYLNDWKTVPDFLNHPKIKIYRSQDEVGDLGDVGKFYCSSEWNGYVFTVDDKIIYPADYATTMINAVEQYQRKAVVSCHGRNLKPNCNSYYYDYQDYFCVFENVQQDTWAHILGTGCTAFHTDTFKTELEQFPHVNMTDIYFSLALQKAKVPILIKSHAKNWIRMSLKHDDNYSIHNFCSRNDGFQTSVVNSFIWHKMQVL